ncbi:MAG: asparagine-linked glycosylation protein [Chaenotheca gracillima]|nr:MAG: asparagine-linked glycosylation protein [Chaenotheca gracillima]
MVGFLLPLTVLVSFLIATLIATPLFVHSLGRFVGWRLRRRTQGRREQILTRVRAEREQRLQKDNERAKNDEEGWEKIESYAAGSSNNGAKAGEEWEGIVGFFHPFCNAGGGGERVLWAAIRATQNRWPKATCVVYTGDHESDKTTIIERVENRFNIILNPASVVFLYLSTRHWVMSTTWPHFTLLGQSLGSLISAYDAFSLLPPDLYIDTMGYAFTLAFSKLLFPDVPTGAYVHYPTISTDMLGSLDEGGQGVNAGSGKGLKGILKRKYWHLFASAYSWSGGDVDAVMTNSSWTQAHMRTLWGPSRTSRHKPHDIEVVFPPVAVEELEEQIEVSPESEGKRERVLLCIAQFRAEKNHALLLEAFSKLMESSPQARPRPRMVLIGSVRHSDDATRVYELRLLAHELKIKDDVEFICDASWPEILNWLGRSSIGVNGMWNEHFGIGVVEYQAAGLVSVVHDSGGPKEDIVVDYDGGPTGFHGTTADEFAAAFEKALALPAKETMVMRRRARASAQRFTEAEFAKRWIVQMERLIKAHGAESKKHQSS